MSGRKSIYWVWRRGDGYVGVTKGATAPSAGSLGGFTVLLETEDWGEARSKVEAERDDDHRAVVASWDATS